MSNDHADIVVVGGGLAGYAAAMAAAETHRVVLVDKNRILGGATTLTNVGTLCGLYYRAEKIRPVAHLFVQKFTDELFRYDSSAKLISLPQHLHVIAYEWQNLQAMLQVHLDKIKIHGQTEVTGIDASTDRIDSLTLRSSDSEIRIKCKAVIDCTGTGRIAGLIQHPMIRSDRYTAAAQVVRLKNVHDADEHSLTMAARRAVLRNKDRYQWPTSYTTVSVVPGSLRDRQVDLKIPLASAVTDDAGLMPRLQREVLDRVPELIHVLLGEVSSLTLASVDTIFPAPGIRIQERPRGSYVLTYDDVVTCRKFDDAIACGTWPIEEWGEDGKVSMQYLDMDRGYDIPARCLTSPGVGNLFFAGKCISAETRAIASARVTGTCLQTGYAAGKLASASSRAK